MQKTNNLQEIFLTQVRRDRRPVTMFLMNGYQMRGYVTGFDAFTVVLSSDGKQMVIYKHAISTYRAAEKSSPGSATSIMWCGIPSISSAVGLAVPMSMRR